MKKSPDEQDNSWTSCLQSVPIFGCCLGYIIQCCKKQDTGPFLIQPDAYAEETDRITNISISNPTMFFDESEIDKGCWSKILRSCPAVFFSCGTSFLIDKHCCQKKFFFDIQDEVLIDDNDYVHDLSNMSSDSTL